MKKPLEKLSIQAFVIALALLEDKLPDTLQAELNEIASSGSLEDNTERLLNMVDIYPPLQIGFRDSRVVAMLRSHSYDLLASQQPGIVLSLPSAEEWVCLASEVFQAPDSVAEVNNLLGTDERFRLIAEYVKSAKARLV